jgi:hypothetical protein
MPTEAQINANRLNAQKSTGPKSREGKAASSLNALKSGIDAWSHIIPGEDPDELEALTAAFLLQYRPTDPTQFSLVDTLISTEWIQRRIDATNRMFLRTLKALQDLQAAPASEPPSPIPTQPLAPHIGFVPQTAPDAETPIRNCGPNATSPGPALADSTRLTQALDRRMHPRRPLRVGAPCE